jgi:hypothetical protein
MAGEVSVMAGVQDKVRERIQEAFMDLIPPEAWEQMVKTELEQFTKTALPGLVRDAAKARLQELLKDEFGKAAWAERWGGGSMGPQCSEMLAAVLREAAPDLVTAMFGSVVQQMVNALRNGSIRPY